MIFAASCRCWRLCFNVEHETPPLVSTSAATVTALVDKDGNALDPSTYVPNPYGFATGFTTMLEAACYDAVNKKFAAYGL